ncbi:TPA: hypothetical protein ACGUPM_002658 [Vibrio vulnificus]
MVRSHLEGRLSLTVATVYQREATQLSETTISYQVGEVEPVSGYANDGRHLHDIELRFLVEVPTSLEGFDLIALDASTRIQRELLDQSFGSEQDVEPVVVVSNMPSRFDPSVGVFARTVTVRQRIRLGPLENDWHEIVGTCDHAGTANQTCGFAGKPSS